MNIFKSGAAALIISMALVATACTNPEQIEYENIEQQALDMWITDYAAREKKPELLNSKQPSGFYIEVLNEGEPNGTAIAGYTGWVYYNYTAADLHGNVGITRNGTTAYQQGTYTQYTHYVPYMAYTSPEYSTISEWTYLTMCSTLNVNGKEFNMRPGSKVRAYVPSSLVSSTSASGGYNGQYELEALRPMVFEMEITSLDVDPSNNELGNVEGFSDDNSIYGDWQDIGALVAKDESFPEEDKKEEIEGIYARTGEMNDFFSQTILPSEYHSEVPISPYNQPLSQLNKKVEDILVKRFGSTVDPEGKVIGFGPESTADLWYVVRGLDGFIIDTNVAELRELLFDEKNPECEALNFNASNDKDNYINALYFAVPFMQYGSWNALITTSTYAYGANGTSGGISSDSSYYDYYYDYYTYYYYYYDSYDDYYQSMYGNYEDNTSTTVATEILPYTPLIFDIFVEAQESDEDE